MTPHPHPTSIPLHRHRVCKLFTTIFINCWLSYMTTKGYLDSFVQKDFMKVTPGCIEHQSKLAAILAEARKTDTSLAVCWLDLENAYGSVHHSLIQFSIQHYHAPAQFWQHPPVTLLRIPWYNQQQQQLIHPHHPTGS